MQVHTVPAGDHTAVPYTYRTAVVTFEISGKKTFYTTRCTGCVHELRFAPRIFYAYLFRAGWSFGWLQLCMDRLESALSVSTYLECEPAAGTHAGRESTKRRASSERSAPPSTVVRCGRSACTMLEKLRHRADHDDHGGRWAPQVMPSVLRCSFSPVCEPAQGSITEQFRHSIHDVRPQHTPSWSMAASPSTRVLRVLHSCT